MKTTAYKDDNGKLHETKHECEIANLETELKITTPQELDEIILYGKKAQRLKTLYDARTKSSSNNEQ